MNLANVKNKLYALLAIHNLKSILLFTNSDRPANFSPGLKLASWHERLHFLEFKLKTRNC